MVDSIKHTLSCYVAGRPPQDFDSLMEFSREFTFRTGKGNPGILAPILPTLADEISFIRDVSFSLRRAPAFGIFFADS